MSMTFGELMPIFYSSATHGTATSISKVITFSLAISKCFGSYSWWEICLQFSGRHVISTSSLRDATYKIQGGKVKAPKVSTFSTNFVERSKLLMEKGEKKEVAQSCPTLCDPVDCSPPGSSIHGILQARILEWVAISFSRGSSWPRDQTQVSRIAGRHFNLWATRVSQTVLFMCLK